MGLQNWLESAGNPFWLLFFAFTPNSGPIDHKRSQFSFRKKNPRNRVRI